MKNHFVWITCLIFLSFQSVSAQAPSGEAREQTGRRAWIMVTSMPDDVVNPLKILSGETLEEIRIYMRSIGEPFKVDESGIVRAVKEITDADGETVYENLSLSTVPEGVREALIVLVPRKHDAAGLRFDSKVIDLAKFKQGGCLYVNLVKTKLGIAIGDFKTVVPPSGMEFINPLEHEEKDVLPVRFFYEVPNETETEWKLMTSSKMAIFKSRREICVFYYNEAIGNVDFRGIPFITPRPEPQTR